MAAQPLGDRAPSSRSPVERWAPVACVVLAVAFVVNQLQIGNLLADTTPTGVDLGGHVWGAWALRHQVLPMSSGWSTDWFGGVPAYRFYPLLPGVLTALLDLVVPYGIALKLTVAAAPVALVAVAWWTGRRLGLRPAAAAALPAGVLLFLFDDSYLAYGGNLRSTIAGEFSQALGTVALLALVGAIAAHLDGRGGRTLPSVLLGVALLCHPVTGLFGVITILLAAALWSADGWRTVATRAAAVTAIGVALGALWWLPFAWRREWLTELGFPRVPIARSTLVPLPWPIEVIGAALVVVALVAATRDRRRAEWLIASLGLAALSLAIVLPAGVFWNARCLPYWHLSRWMLAALGTVEVGRWLAVRLPGRRGIDAAVVGGVTAIVVLGLAAQTGSLPGGSTGTRTTAAGGTEPTVSYLGLPEFVPNINPTWISEGFSGYERRSSWPEYRALMDTLGDVGAQHGCGSAMFEWDAEGRYGSQFATSLAPYWTNGCIGAERGLWVDSSATSPAILLAEAAVSANGGSQNQQGLPYGRLDLRLGIGVLRPLGVRYLALYSQQATAAAKAEPGVSVVGTSGPWTVLDLGDAPLVQALGVEPAVDTMLTGRDAWTDATVAWVGGRVSVPITGDGPASWQRVSDVSSGTSRPVTPVTVSDVTSTRDGHIRFHVDRPGSPVAIRTSAYATWRVSGADGPYRLVPNLLVVVPTSTDVELSHGTDPAERLGWAASIAGLVALVALAVVTGSWRRGAGASAGTDAGDAGIDASITDERAPRRR